jgi:hypothetical protein
MPKSDIPEQFPALCKAVVTLFHTTSSSNQANMPDAKRDAYVLGLAQLPESDVLDAIARIQDDPEVRGMPTLAQIKARMRSKGGQTGVDMSRAFAWWDDGGTVRTMGDPGSVPRKARVPIVLHAKRSAMDWRKLAGVLGVGESDVLAVEAAEGADPRVEPEDPFSDEALARA